MLVECEDCKNPVSVKASACPKCGAPIHTPLKETEETIGGVIPKGEWDEFMSTMGKAVPFAIVATIIFNLFFFERSLRFLAETIMKNEGVWGIDRAFFHITTDYSAIVEEMGWGAYIVPFLVFLGIYYGIRAVFK
ncbi:hypothetical protein [Shimia sediminis]|uniref:hypothetical protein n=1 Tax=Shimia sediminis TaxID=2497945 RepID=UPI0013DE97B8|nr:hypothetical protein [Shimia sediminis]